MRCCSLGEVRLFRRVHRLSSTGNTLTAHRTPHTLLRLAAWPDALAPRALDSSCCLWQVRATRDVIHFGWTWRRATRYIGVLDLVTVYLANLLMPHCYPLIDFGSYGSRTLVSRLASLSEAHMTYSKHKQRDTNSLASSGFWTGTRTRARKRLQSCSSTLDTLACHH